ncbi:MAG: TonB family protein [Victivallales bacterium]
MTDKIYNLSQFYDNDDTLFDKDRSRAVFFSVIVFHVVFIAGPFLFFALWEKFYDKKPAPMVIIATFNPEPIKSDEPPGNPPEQKKEEPKNTKKEEPQPEEEAVPEPPAPTPKKPVVEQPPPPPEPKIKIPSDTKPKPVVKPPEKETPKEPPKEWKPKKPNEIIPSSKVVKGKAPTPKINASSLADKLKSIQNQCKITSTNNNNNNTGSPTGLPNNANAAGTVSASYYDQVTVFLYDMWQQPSKADVKNQKPTVTIHIAIDSAGNVKSARIVRKSGIPAMDASVEELLSRLKTLPKPPQGADEFDALLGIDDN